MRRLLVASVLAAGLAGSLAASVPPPPVRQGQHMHVKRKTMGFGPEHPRAVFRTDVPEAFQPSLTSWSRPDLFQVALDFVKTLLPSTSAFSEAEGAVSFYVRSDSYVDKNTGIAHVYLRQTVYHIEVADGDVNVNIDAETGRILSYGSSIHTSELPSPSFFESASKNDLHGQHCGALEKELGQRIDAAQERLAWLSVPTGQAVVGRAAGLVSAVYKETVGNLQDLYLSNCGHRADLPVNSISWDSETPTDGDPLPALLTFMIHATPSSDLAQSIVESPQEYLDNMSFSMAHHLMNKDASIGQAIEVDGVPDATDKVRGRLAWVQVPKEGSNGETELELVWKFEVPMADNWYEAAVTYAAPHRIVSVVDWAADGFVDEPLNFGFGPEEVEAIAAPKPTSKAKGCKMRTKSASFAPVPKEPSLPETRSPAVYHVFPWGVNDPSEGNRTYELENFDALASPVGWQVVELSSEPGLKGGFRNTSTTWGNNVFAHENWEGENAWVTNYRPEGVVNATAKGEHVVFDFPYAPKETERTDTMKEARKYINTTVTQLFYTSNLVHDLFYRYGFDEVSGNFQQHNFGRGGKEGDAVIANAQDGSGFNNANFMTPPDGQNGRCRMYLWNTANPYRDGDLEAGIVIHELAHGLSTRLTGGPANSGCLGWGESGGMGEGWGDFLATTIRSVKDRVEDAKLAGDGLGEPREYPMGAWAANRVGGIRNFVYSLNDTINPSTYKTLDKPGYWGVHAIGEVWAEILWVVEQGLIKKHGFSDTLFPPKPLADGTVPLGDFYTNATGKLVPKHGNTLAVQLVITGMKLQPCRPSFFDARDAIIAADQHLTGGANFCELWRGFAARGLGPDARVDGRTPWGGGVRTDDFKVPKDCLAEEPSPTPGPGDGDDDEDWRL